MKIAHEWKAHRQKAHERKAYEGKAHEAIPQQKSGMAGGFNKRI